MWRSCYPSRTRLRITCVASRWRRLRYFIIHFLPKSVGVPTLHVSKNPPNLECWQTRKTGGAVPFVVVSAAFDLSGAHGQQQCGAVRRLNLAFLVHAQHQGAVGRVEVEADDIANFVDKQRIAAQLEGSAAVGWSERARQMRLMLLWLSPVAWAEWRLAVGFPKCAPARVPPRRHSSGAACPDGVHRAVHRHGEGQNAVATCPRWRAQHALGEPPRCCSGLRRRAARARNASACAVLGRRVHSNNRCRSAEARVRGESGQPRAMRFLLLISDAETTISYHTNIRLRTLDALEVGCKAQGDTPRRSDGIAGEQTTEIEHVKDVVKVLSVDLKPHLHRV